MLDCGSSSTRMGPRVHFTDGNIEDQTKKAPRKPGQRSAGPYVGCVHRQRQRRPTALRLPRGKEAAGMWSDTIAFIGSRIRMRRQAAVEETLGRLPSFPQQVSLIPPYLHPVCRSRGQGSDSDPCRGGREQGSPIARSHMGLLGRRAGQRVSWDRTWWGWGDALEAEGLASPTGQHPDLRLRGSWLRHGGWALLWQRARGKCDPHPLRTCG